MALGYSKLNTIQYANLSVAQYASLIIDPSGVVDAKTVKVEVFETTKIVEKFERTKVIEAE